MFQVYNLNNFFITNFNFPFRLNYNGFRRNNDSAKVISDNWTDMWLKNDFYPVNKKEQKFLQDFVNTQCTYFKSGQINISSLIKLQKRYFETKYPKAQNLNEEPNQSRDTTKTTYLNKDHIKRILKLGLVISMILIAQETLKSTKIISFPISNQSDTVRLDDVIGCEEVKKEFRTIINYLKDPEKYNNIGAKVPKGIILIGEPGVGKTMLSKALANEVNAKIIFKCGSEFEHLFVGSGSKAVSQMFREARLTYNGLTIIFIDEIDTLLRKRTYSSLNPYANQTINQFLSEMDGLKDLNNVLVIGTTNRFSSMDEAALRPGRFDFHIHMYPPNFNSRKQLFEHYLSKVYNVDKIDLDKLAYLTDGASGADIASIVNEANILSIKKDSSYVTMDDLIEADRSIKWGIKKNKINPDIEIKRYAAYAAARAVIIYLSKNTNYEITKLSIIHHGRNHFNERIIHKEIDKGVFEKSYFLNNIDIQMAGRVAEELIFGVDHLSSISKEYLDKATSIAKKLVMQLTMSENVGLQVFSGSSNCPNNCSNVSDKTHEMIDDEINKLLVESYYRVKTILKNNEKKFHKLIENLIKYQELSHEQIIEILEINVPIKPNPSGNYYHNADTLNTNIIDPTDFISPHLL